MIERFRVQNFKALRDVTLDLTPIHVLIGANDTGKTSILEAIAALSRSCDRKLEFSFLGSWDGADLVWHRDSRSFVTFSATGTSRGNRILYKLECCFNAKGRGVVSPHESVQVGEAGLPIVLDLNQGKTRVFRITSAPVVGYDEARMPCEAVVNAIGGSEYLRLIPRWLALPVAPNSARKLRLESSGFGLASCLDGILGYDRDRFIELERRFKELFPMVESIRLLPEPGYSASVDDPQHRPIMSEAEGKGIWFRMAGGVEMSATQVSDGMLIVLAFVTLLSLPNPPRILLLEEPENGVHPARLKEIVAILKEMVGSGNQTQVIMTTHSPYLLDSFSPNEVSLCRKEPDGSVSVHRLSESKAVHDQRNIFTLGEIWTGEGDDALVEKARPTEDVTT